MVNNNKSDSVNRQRGSGLVMVLIALAVGAMLIPTTLNYVYTGLRATPISERLLLDQYTADAAIEYGLWQLKYNVDNVTGELSILNPSSNSTIIVNGEEVTLNTEISMSPTSDNGTFSMPAIQSGIHIAVGLDVLQQVWTKAGNKAYVTHVIYVYNYGTSATHLKALFQELDPRLNYVPGSYIGPDADLTKSPVGDHWELLFEFDEPQPKLNSLDWMVITFSTWTFDEMGEHEYQGSGWVEYAGFQEDAIEAYDGESGPASFGLYDLTVTVGSYTFMVNAGVTTEGEVVIRSWQVE